jgi:hypothetical protein
MADKRLLYLTAQRLHAYSWSSGKLVDDAAFESGDAGVEEFGRYLARSAGSLFYVIADVIEEDFFQENIPFVRGKDRRMLLMRKIAQRYRDTSLALATSLGMQEGGRREERILFSSFTNTQQFQPWLAALRSSESRLVGIYSFALITPLLAKRLKIEHKRFVMVSVQEGGMRQSYVEDGKIRFSRLGRADPTDPRATAEACAAEADRILQYLINLRILPRETGPLDVVALAPADQRDAYLAAWGENPRLKLTLLDIESACKTAGLASAPPAMLAERLFMHVLATAQPSEQFARDALRRHFHLWRARLALLAGGAAVCAFSLLLGGLRALEIGQINGEIQTDAQQEAAVNREYDRVQTTFPKTPLPREMLKSAVGSAGAIVRQSRSPGGMLAEISLALAAVPQVELDKLDWGITADPRPPSPADASKAGTAPGAPKEPEKPAEGDRIFEVVDITAHINGVKGSDYRAINVMVDQFAGALRQRPGVQVISTRTPFDLLTEKPISGEVGEEENAGVPSFTVRISRRIES